MSNNTRKIVVLNKLNSPQIEQAIFILRDEAPISEKDALTEAQKIVDRYIKSLSMKPIEREPKKSKLRFVVGLMLYTFATVIMTAYLMPLF